MDSADALLKKVQSVLKAVPDISNLVSARVYGAVPANPVYPYILITCTSEEFSTDDVTGMQHTLRVQAFARELKPATVSALRKASYATLNRQEVNLAVPGHNLSLIEHEGIADAFPEPDGRTYQSLIEFKVQIQ